MKSILPIFIFFLSATGFAAINTRSLSPTARFQELKRLAREIEVLAEWKDAKAFLQISQRIEQMKRLQKAADTHPQILQLRELAEIYRDGTTPPEKFFEFAKDRAQLLQEDISLESARIKK